MIDFSFLLHIFLWILYSPPFPLLFPLFPLYFLIFYIFFPGENSYILFYSLIILFYCSALLFWTIIFPFVPVSHCSFILLFHCSIVLFFCCSSLLFSFICHYFLLFSRFVVCSFVSPFYCSLFIVLDHINTPVCYLGIPVTHLDSSSSYWVAQAISSVKSSVLSLFEQFECGKYYHFLLFISYLYLSTLLHVWTSFLVNKPLCISCLDCKDHCVQAFRCISCKASQHQSQTEVRQELERSLGGTED